MATHTPITDFLNLPIIRFYQISISICNVIERQRR